MIRYISLSMNLSLAGLALMIVLDFKSGGLHAADAIADTVTLFPDDSIRSLEGGNPLGINVNYFEDNDKNLKASRSTSEALKEMGVKYLRYPGGAKSDYYFFSLPPYDHSIPTMEQSGPGSNASRAEFFSPDRTNYGKPPLDFDHFMTICTQIGATPLIVVPINTYIMTPDKMPGSTAETKTSSRSDYLRNAVEWVRYANLKKGYKIKYWILGNETETCYFKDKYGKQYGYTPELYARDIVEFSAAMKGIDPSIKIVSNGAAWLVKAYLGKPGVAGAIDDIATSNYPLSKTKYTGYDDWVARQKNHGDLVQPVEDVLKEIDQCSTISAEKRESLMVIATEFGPATWWPDTWPTGQDLGHALFNFDIAGQILSNPRCLVGCFWNTRWHARDVGSGYNALSDVNTLLPLGQSLALWGNYLFPTMIRASQVKDTVSYASFDRTRSEVYYDVINQGPSARFVELGVAGKSIKSISKVGEVAGEDPKSSRTQFALCECVPVKGTELTLDPYSITVFDVSF